MTTAKLCLSKLRKFWHHFNSTRSTLAQRTSLVDDISHSSSSSYLESAIVLTRCYACMPNKRLCRRVCVCVSEQVCEWVCRRVSVFVLTRAYVIEREGVVREKKVRRVCLSLCVLFEYVSLWSLTAHTHKYVWSHDNHITQLWTRIMLLLFLRIMLLLLLIWSTFHMREMMIIMTACIYLGLSK